jgi:hypothetical protein
MRFISFVLLLSILFLVTVAPIHFRQIQVNTSDIEHIATLDVCNSGSGFSVNSNASSYIHQCPCEFSNAHLFGYSDSILPEVNPQLFAFRIERPPRV